MSTHAEPVPLPSPETLYGLWQSPISAEMAARVEASSRNLEVISIDPQGIWCIEQRLDGTTPLVWRNPLGEIIKELPSPFSARTRMYAFGGGSALVVDSVAFFSNARDDALYMWHGWAAPVCLTPPEEGVYRKFADFSYDKQRRRLIFVMEERRKGALPTFSIAAMPVQGGEIRKLVTGRQFYAAPRVSPEGTKLAWMCWSAPDMPWDQTQVWTATLHDDGISDPVHAAGQPGESVLQPEWSPEGRLYWISDKTGWWNLYREHPNGAQPVWAKEADFARPPWTLGGSSYGFFDLGTLVCSYVRDGFWRLAVLDTETLAHAEIADAPIDISTVRVSRRHAALVGASSTRSSEVYVLSRNFRLNPLKEPELPGLTEEWISKAEHLTIPLPTGESTHALLFRPQNPAHGEANTKPPLYLFAHGGPIAASSSGLSMRTQFFTSRGFAVVLMDYRGSSGYGRRYREALKGQWGVVDVEDCVTTAQYLAEHGVVDSSRMIMAGGSAGGFAALGTIALHKVFQAAVDYCGICDPEALRQDAEASGAGFVDVLLGGDAAQAARERSPLRHASDINCPVLMFHGAKDSIVKIEHSRALANALQALGKPVKFFEFPDEGHNFGHPKNICACLEHELDFLTQVLNLSATPQTTV